MEYSERQAGDLRKLDGGICESERVAKPRNEIGPGDRGSNGRGQGFFVRTRRRSVTSRELDAATIN